MFAEGLLGGNEKVEASSNRKITITLVCGIIIYPILLDLFHWAGQLASNNTGFISVLAWVSVSILLLLVFMVPLYGFLIALRYGRKPQLTRDDLRIRQLCHFAVAVPPLYSAMGAYFILFGISGYDLYIWSLVWVLVLIRVTTKAVDTSPIIMENYVPPAWLRISHGAVAAVAIVSFVIIHLLHNVTGLIGAEFYGQLQDILRRWYQATWIEPIIITTFLFLMGSGIGLLRYRIATLRNAWGTLLTTTGAYIGAFLLAHMTAALVVARWKYGIETNWGWAAGEPVGLFADAWSVRLIPYYVLAPAAVIAHSVCGLRLVFADRGIQIKSYERIARIVMASGVILSLLVITALLGMQLSD